MGCLGALLWVMLAAEPMVRSKESAEVGTISCHDIVRQAEAGDGSAFRQIFDEHAPAVRRFVFDILKTAELADDATQETFVRAHARLASLRDASKLSSWLLGIARFVALERLRGLKKDRMHDSIDSDDSSPNLRAEAPSPATLLLTAEADRVLADALADLSDERKQVLLLRIDHHLGYDEIAELMNWSLSKVKNEIHRARVQLRKQLAHYAPGAS